MKKTHKEILKYQSEEVRLPTAGRTEMRTRRDTNRKRLKTGLANNGSPLPVGCRTQGSYAMHTMVQDEYNEFDIDDGVYFEAGDLVGPRGAPMSPLQVRQMVWDALQDDRFSHPPELKKNCVRVKYSEGYHVDVPAYRRSKTTDVWSGKVAYSYELASSNWRESDPKAVTKWFDETNAALSPSTEGEGQFRRIVRLLKMFAKSRDSWRGKKR